MRLNWKPPKIFYGWWVVAACFLISLYIGGAIVFGFTAFFEPIANEFGWSYTQISLASSLRGVELGLLAPIAGFLVDRWGPRRLMFGGVILISLGLFLVSRTTSLGMFYGGFALVAIGTSSCSATVFYTAIANWFRKKYGMATEPTAVYAALNATDGLQETSAGVIDPNDHIKVVKIVIGGSGGWMDETAYIDDFVLAGP